MLLAGKKILIGITGSIAAYKSILLLRLLVKEGAEVKIVMTAAAKDFVSPLVLSVLSKNKVVLDWQEQNEWNNHVALGRWADLMVMAPLSCNTLAKMATGACDNVLMAVYLSATCPVLASPAMDEDMWHHPAVQENIEKIKTFGNHVIPVNTGALASGLYGEGRMAEPEEIRDYLVEQFFRTQDFAGKKVMISAGPTYEPVDPIRFIGNRSSGKMGFALAKAFFLKGAEVVLVTGPNNLPPLYKGIHIIQVQTAKQMLDACIKQSDAGIIVMSAAVADYTSAAPATQKIKKAGDQLQITLQKTEDVLLYLGQHKKAGQFIAGFALETENEETNAIEKLHKKNLDCVFLNSLNEKGAGFDTDTNKVTIIDHQQKQTLALSSKLDIAFQLVEYIREKVIE